MEKLQKLLESAVVSAKFDIGRVEKPRSGLSISYPSRPEEMVDSDRLEEMIATTGWYATEYIQASGAHLVADDQLLTDLRKYVSQLLKDYIDPATDRIGHAFPTGGRQEYHVGYTDGNISIDTWSSPVESFIESLVKGAAVAGPESLVNRLLCWLAGDPIEYRIAAILNGITVSEPIEPIDGVLIEPLPISADRLPVHLSDRLGMSADQYLGRTVVYLEQHASPAIFRPDSKSVAELVEVSAVAGLDFDTVCAGISLESDAHVETGFYWVHYPTFPGLIRVDAGHSWSFDNQRFETWPLTLRGPTARNFDLEGTLFPDGTLGPKICEKRLGETIRALAELEPDDVTWTAISRWMKSRDRRQNLADQFIDLRIALETLYLQDFTNDKYRQEMRFRLALYGAWHLGDDLNDRRKIRKQLLAAYDSASTAVHVGAVEHEPANTGKLSEGQKLCRQGIQKFLKKDVPPDWTGLILGSESG